MLQSMGFQRVGHDLVTEKQQQLKKKISVPGDIWYFKVTEGGCEIPEALGGRK